MYVTGTTSAAAELARTYDKAALLGMYLTHDDKNSYMHVRSGLSMAGLSVDIENECVYDANGATLISKGQVCAHCNGLHLSHTNRKSRWILIREGFSTGMLPWLLKVMLASDIRLS